MKQAPAYGALAILIVLAAGCGSSDPAANSPDAAGIDGGSTCTMNGFAPATEMAERDVDLDLLFYTGVTAGPDSFDRLTLDFYFSVGASKVPHSFTFTGQDPGACHTCYMMRRGCSATSCVNAATFLAQSGTLEVTGIGDGGDTLAATITDARLAEVTIDFGTQTATLVPGGGVWCVDSYAIDVPIVGL